MNREQRRKQGKVLPLTRKVRFSDLVPSPVRHTPDPAWLPQIEHLRATFTENNPKTIEEWEEGFCRDVSPEREIDIWMQMAAKFTRARARRDFNAAERQDIYALVVAWSVNMTPTEALAMVKTLGWREAEDILREIGQP